MGNRKINVMTIDFFYAMCNGKPSCMPRLLASDAYADGFHERGTCGGERDTAAQD